MPRSRKRGGTRIPRSGDDTRRPAMLISPPVGCSSPATQRRVVVWPQPEGPRSTTISPAGTAKLTPSIAGRPIENCLRRSVTSSVAVMISNASWAQRSLPITKSLVPLGNPGGVQLYVLVEVRVPDFYDLGIEAFRIDRRHFQRRQVAEFLDHERLALLGHAPVEEQSCGVGMSGGLRNSGSIGIDRHALGREDNLYRRALLLFRVDPIINQRPHPNPAPNPHTHHPRPAQIENRMGRPLLRPIILSYHLALEHDPPPD